MEKQPSSDAPEERALYFFNYFCYHSATLPTHQTPKAKHCMRSFIFCLLIVVTSSVCAQPSSDLPASSTSWFERDVALFLRLTGKGFAAPLSWEGEDWKNAAALVFGTAVSSTLDDEAYNATLRNQTPTNDDLERLFEAYSNGLSGILLSGMLYGVGVAFESEWLHGTGLVMASALTISAITQTTLKYITGRARPYTGLGNHTFRPFSFNADFVAFPSGHTIVAFTISTVLAERIGNPFASFVLYTAATLGGISRIYSGNHWLSDVVFGAGMAFSVSRSVLKWYGEESTAAGQGERVRTAPLRMAGVEIHPTMNRIVLVWRF
ncbi:MAG TPA: phosphatase PAP2 family protein [Bacteroidota bacterium]|nr:phosphatase PAP2 family protein [Bacteroidota bacterium]